jgi:hypothetical protein
MNELDPSKMNEQEMKDFMAAQPSREEVNKYMNNMFASINNSFGVFQGYTVAALGLTTISYLKDAGVDVTLDQFMAKFFENNKAVIEQATATMQAAAEANQADGTEPAKEVDISIF